MRRPAIVVVVSAVAALCCRVATGAPLPRPEHPFPQMVRGEWLSLNGEWEFAETDAAGDGPYLGDQAYPDRIVVPFCRESKLSGLERKSFVKNVWYRRAFTVPAGWRSPRVRLHIGACDWRTRVWVNGGACGEHTGGTTPFWFDVTRLLEPGGNTVIVHAFDDTRSGLQATGKQAHSLNSEGCVYTRTTGIWQTVWLEGVGESFVRDVRLTCDVDAGRLALQAEVDGPCEGLTFKAVARANGKEVAAAEAPAEWRNTNVVLALAEKLPWSPETPFLYDCTLVLARGDRVVDKVTTYFGLREVAIRGAAILINGKAVFQRTVLDQGFYPDGIWTAPSDAALKNDIALSQACGFNGARLHQKVFEPRFLYWADVLGYLVWGEYPNWGLRYGAPGVDLTVMQEWVEILRRDRNHPAVIGWCPFNETPGEAVPLQNAVVRVTRAIDPSRPIIDSSGWSHGLPDPEVLDAHDYDQNPESFRNRWTLGYGPGAAIPARYGTSRDWRPVPFFVSEYGGIGWNVSGGWGYGVPENLEGFYTRFKGLTDALLDNRWMFGYCYTQLTDIEQEQNGMYFYDRRPKFDVERLRKIQTRRAAYEESPPVALEPRASGDWKVLVAAAPDGALAREWRYTLDAPAEGWMRAGFDDAAWKLGRGGFGLKGEAERWIKTPWRTKDIWLRQKFEFDGAAFDRALLVAHYDNATEVYVNGALVWKGAGWNDAYAGFDITAALAEALVRGANTVAMHCHQDEGGQFIDAAVLVSAGK